ncbi:centromere protein I [Lipomyces arxii]|uniref:centromere protein I n=1 Tax=Lipomyces arxii TaxID=56418 RepID=UPI0034CEA10A
MSEGLDLQLTPQQKITEAISGLHAAVRSDISKSTASDYLSMLTVYVPEHGLSGSDLSKAIAVLTMPSSLLTSSSLQLVKLLYPRDRVEDDIVVNIVGCLGSGDGKPDFSVQISLLRWLVLIQPFLRTQAVLSQVYSILFMYLGYESIRRWTCHLLFLATKRKDIYPWRIQYLLELQNKYRDSQHLTGLLMLYKEYYPDIVVDRFGNFRGSLFKYPDQQFLTAINDLQSRLHRHESEASVARSALTGPKRRRLNIPEVATIDPSGKSVTVEELTNLAAFAQNIDKVTLPAQVGSVFRDDGMVKRILVNRPTELAWERFNTWLASCLQQEFELSKRSDDDDALRELLLRSYELCQYTKQSFVSVQNFLRIYIGQWNGVKNRDIIFKMLLQLPLRKWESLSKDIVTPLTSIYDSNSQSWEFRYDYLMFMADLTRLYAACLLSDEQDEVGEMNREDIITASAKLVAHWEELYDKVKFGDQGYAKVVQAAVYMHQVVKMFGKSI